MFSSTPGTRYGDAQASRFYEYAAGKIELSHVVTLKHAQGVSEWSHQGQFAG